MNTYIVRRKKRKEFIHSVATRTHLYRRQSAKKGNSETTKEERSEQRGRTFIIGEDQEEIATQTHLYGEKKKD